VAEKENERKKPDLNEMIKDLSGYIQKKYGGQPVFSFSPPPRPKPRPPEKEAGDDFKLEFNYTPKQIKDYLDRFVIKQEEAKKVLSIAVCDHYNHATRDLDRQADYDYSKQNVIMIGPTGVGKTYLVKCVARLIGVPFVKADATKYSETGYVGRNVEDMVRELVQRADGNLKLAQYGIIYIDEVDKIASAFNVGGKDVSGAGVQRNLLKLMEETEVPLRDPMDMTSQIEAVMEFQRKGKIHPKVINTRHILFIVSGAFEEMAEITKRRLTQQAVGFGAKLTEKKKRFQYLQAAQTRDFIQYGLEPEFIGRLPVRVVCRELIPDDLFQILIRSEGSIIKQYQASFRSFGVELVFTRQGLKEIAHRAHREETGARGLLTVCEKILRNFKYEIPSTSIKHLTVDQRLVKNPAAALRKILKNPDQADISYLKEIIRRFEVRFFQEHQLKIKFTPAAIKLAAKEAGKRGMPLEGFCAMLLRDYPYGLKLLMQDRREKEFTITRAAVARPEETLSRKIKESFKEPQKNNRRNS